MTHFLGLSCLSYIRAWYLTAPAVMAGAERDAALESMGGFSFDEAPALPSPCTPSYTNSRPRLAPDPD